MSNPGFGSQGGQRGSRPQVSDTNRKTVPETTAETIRSGAGQARQVASDAASSIGDQVKGLLDDQVDHGADLVARFASATKRAAEELDGASPQAARLVRGVADRLDDYADGLRDQSIDQLMRTASDFTRRQPAVVFGVAALVGFFALRTFKSASLRSQRFSRSDGPRASSERRPDA
jgi:ElaB/YqjD/DUF883 family membrane-anchored ribosome-binding protein